MTSPAVHQGIPPESLDDQVAAYLNKCAAEKVHPGLAKLREPFPDAAVGHRNQGGTTLSYVGHAAVTDRLLSIDPLWNWEPLAHDENGLPRFVRASAGNALGLWIRLTVCGVTRLGYGSVAPNAFDAEKQLIGDAIRNAAMRFGVALALWSRDELESEIEAPPSKSQPKPKDTRPKEVRDMEKRTAQHDALANTEAATKAREQMAADLLDNRGPRNVLGIPVLLTWPVAKDMQIGSYAATYKPGVPSAKDLAVKTWGWASEGSSQGEREAFLEALVNRARELVKKDATLPLPNNLQCAVLSYDRMQARLSSAPVSSEEV